MQIQHGILIALSLAACADLSTPADLAQPQIIALTADPPSLGSSEQALLDVLIAGPDGEIPPSRVVWSTAGVSGAEVSRLQDDTWLLQAPPSIEGSPYAELEVSVLLDDGTTLMGARSVALGTRRTQPIIVDILVNGQALPLGETLQVAVNAELELALKVSPTMTDLSIVSWFSNVGEFEHYRRTPARFLARETDNGSLFVVYRDGSGGLTYRVLNVEITP